MNRFFHCFSVLLAALWMVLLPVSAQNTRQQERKKARLEREIAVLDQQLKQNDRQKKNALSKMELLKRKIGARKELLSESEQDIRNLDGRIAVQRRQLASLQARLDTLTYYYERLVRSAYKNRDARVWYMYVLGSENIGQGLRRLSYLKGLSANMNAQAVKIKGLQEEVRRQGDSLEVLRGEARQLRSEHARELQSLQSDEAASKKNLEELNRNRTVYMASLKKKQQQVEALNREIDRIIRSATARKGEKGGKPAKPVDMKLSGEFSANKGKLPWPAEGSVVERFGQHFHPVYTRVKLPFNNGITLATAASAPVKAVFNGTVKQIVVMPGYNQCVLVQHGSYFTFYCKLGAVRVKAGDKVTTGQVLGTVDTIAGETRLHFQIWQERTPQNPELWLR